jgi:predicted DNA-binding antitoxin AbrB/MazE fold protein
MVVSVRAVYKEGHLHLLDPVDLAEGQIVDVTIQQQALSPEQVDALLDAAGILMDTSDIDVDESDELSPEERYRIGLQFVGNRPSEDLIDEDRGLY